MSQHSNISNSEVNPTSPYCSQHSIDTPLSIDSVGLNFPGLLDAYVFQGCNSATLVGFGRPWQKTMWSESPTPRIYCWLLCGCSSASRWVSSESKNSVETHNSYFQQAFQTSLICIQIFPVAQRDVFSKLIRILRYFAIFPSCRSPLYLFTSLRSTGCTSSPCWSSLCFWARILASASADRTSPRTMKFCLSPRLYLWHINPYFTPGWWRP